MRPIDADAHECWACTHHATGKCDTFCDHGESFELREDVKNAPTIEAKPVVHGEWNHKGEQNDFLHCECAVCGYTTESYRAIKEYGISSTDYISYAWHFCPKCGAEMRKKVSNHEDNI